MEYSSWAVSNGPGAGNLLNLRTHTTRSEALNVADERIFLAPETASFLDDKLLDADIVDDEVQFSLDIQAESQ